MVDDLNSKLDELGQRANQALSLRQDSAPDRALLIALRERRFHRRVRLWVSVSFAAALVLAAVIVTATFPRRGATSLVDKQPEIAAANRPPALADLNRNNLEIGGTVSLDNLRLDGAPIHPTTRPDPHALTTTKPREPNEPDHDREPMP